MCAICDRREKTHAARRASDPSWLPNALKPKRCTWALCHKKTIGRGYCRAHYPKWMALREAIESAAWYGDRREWTREENDFLVEHWGHVEVAALARVFARTEKAIEKHAWIVLGLGPQVPAGWVFINACKTRFGFSREGLLALLTRAGVAVRSVRTTRNTGGSTRKIARVAEVERAVREALSRETCVCAARRLGVYKAALALAAEMRGLPRFGHGWMLLPAQWDAIAASAEMRRARDRLTAEARRRREQAALHPVPRAA